MRQRDEEIWRLRNEGATYSQIAKQFDLSSDRVRQICFKKKARMENAGKWPPLKRELPARVRNALIKAFGSEEILNHPETLASLGEEVFVTWPNIYRKSAHDLSDALERLGYSVNRGDKVTDLRGEVNLKIGRTILRKYFDYYKEKSLDDTEYIPVVRLIIEGIAQEMGSSGLLEPNCREVAGKLKAFNGSLKLHRSVG